MPDIRTTPPDPARAPTWPERLAGAGKAAAPAVAGHFGARLFPDEVQVAATVSPDGNEISLLLTGCEVRLERGGGPAARSLAFRLRLHEVGEFGRLRVHLRGGGVVPAEAVATLAVTLAGVAETAVWTPAGPEGGADLLLELVREVPAGGWLDGVITLALAPAPAAPAAAAAPATGVLLALDSLDVALEPAPKSG